MQEVGKGVPPNRRIRVAMVGAGGMANKVHYPSLASFDDVEFAGICDLDPERLRKTADKYGIARRYSEYRKMIEEVAPDAVYAIADPDVMYPHWVWLLEHKLNLFIEKPMGITIHQARMLAYLAEKNGCITQVGFQRRNAPILVRLREECLKHGPIVHAVGRFYKNQTAPYVIAMDRLLNDAVHTVDLLRWMCGGEVLKLHSIVRRVDMPDLNFVSAMFEFDNGSTGIMVSSWTSGRRVIDVEMHSKGICVEADIEGKGYVYINDDIKGIEYDTRQVAGSDEFFVFGGYRAKNREFIDCLISRTQPSSSFSDALQTMEVTQRILAQALLGE